MITTIDKYEDALSDLDSDFQWWILFDKEEVDRLRNVAHETLAIINDAFFRVNGDKRTPVEKAFAKAERSIDLQQAVEALRDSIYDECGSYQRELVDKVLFLIK